MCCSDGIQQPTPPPPVRPQPNTQSGPPCNTPDGYGGYCIGNVADFTLIDLARSTKWIITGVKQCPSVLQTFIQRQKDPEYIKYIRQSNANCNYQAQAICCPTDAPPAGETQPTPPPPSPITRPDSGGRNALLLTTEGCGVSKVPHNRVVGGVPAKKGERRWSSSLNSSPSGGFPNVI